MASEWFAVIDGQQAGPYSTAQMKDLKKAGTVNQDTPVWCEGMADWQPFSTVTARLDEGPTTAPLPSSSGSFTSASTDQNASPYAAPQADLGTEPNANFSGIKTSSPYGPFKDPRPVSWTVRGFLITSLAISCLTMVALVYQLQFFNDTQNGVYSQAAYSQTAKENEMRFILLHWVSLGISFSCGLAWAFWTNRISKNGWAMNTLAMDTSPGWAVGWFFVPVASLWKPFVALKEAWDITIQNSSGLIGWWWALFIVTGFSEPIARASMNNVYSVQDAINSTHITMVHMGLNLISTVVAFLMVAKLTKSQVNYATQASLTA